MAEISLLPAQSPDLNAIVTDYTLGTAQQFATALQGNQDTLEDRDRKVQSALELLTARFGNGAITGGAITAGTGLSVNVAALAAIVGNWVGFDASQIVGGLSPHVIVDNALNYLFLRQDGTWYANTTGTDPTSADGHGSALLWGTATTVSGAVTAVSNVRRTFLQNRAQIPLLTAAPANAVSGDVYGRTDTTTLHIEGLGDFTVGGGGGGSGNMTFRGTYDAGTTYAADDVVIGGDGLGYIANGSTLGNAPPDMAHWTPLGTMGATGATGAAGPTGPAGAQGLTWRGAWSSGTAYVAYDMVSYSGSSYIAVADGTNQNPATATAYWQIVAQGGATGATGATGDDGAAGSQIYNAAGAPSGGTGVNGDYYFDTTVWDVYEKAGGVWGYIGNIRGAQGSTGLQGTPGQGVPVGGTTGQVLSKVSNTDYDTHWSAAGGAGTVTSVGLSLPAEVTVSGSPVTGAGTLTGAWANQTTNKVFAAPNGSTGTPAFRALVAADIPAIPESGVTNLTTDLAAKEATANKGVANGYAGLDSGGKVPTSQLPSSIVGGVDYQGTWNASTNSPTLASGTGTKGYYYKVSVAGTTSIDGNASWNVGDWIVFDGTVWEKVDNYEAVTSVAGRVGAVTLTAADIASGTIATGRLGSGTANSLTFLRGDQTYATPTGTDHWQGVVEVTTTPYTILATDDLILGSPGGLIGAGI